MAAPNVICVPLMALQEESDSRKMNYLCIWAAAQEEL